MTDVAAIDRVKLHALRQELGAHFPRILGYFAEDGIKSIDAIEQAVQARDAVAMVRPAHTLKGEALQFGAVPLGSAAELIEKTARQAVEDHLFPFDMIEHVICLRPLFERALNALRCETAPPAYGQATRRTAGCFGRKVG